MRGDLHACQRHKDRQEIRKHNPNRQVSHRLKWFGLTSIGDGIKQRT